MCLIAFVKHLQPLLPRLTTLEFLNPLVMMRIVASRVELLTYSIARMSAGVLQGLDMWMLRLELSLASETRNFCIRPTSISESPRNEDAISGFELCLTELTV